MLTVDDLRQMPEWEHYPGADVLYSDGADEGVGHGFDQLDPSAFIRAYFQTEDSWADVVEWYRARLESLGWSARRNPTAGGFSRHRGESIVLIDCSRVDSGRWLPKTARSATGTVFSVYLKR